jgi:hypothetical protein
MPSGKCHCAGQSSPAYRLSRSDNPWLLAVAGRLWGHRSLVRSRLPAAGMEPTDSSPASLAGTLHRSRKFLCHWPAVTQSVRLLLAVPATLNQPSSKKNDVEDQHAHQDSSQFGPLPFCLPLHKRAFRKEWAGRIHCGLDSTRFNRLSFSFTKATAKRSFKATDLVCAGFNRPAVGMDRTAAARSAATLNARANWPNWRSRIAEMGRPHNRISPSFR